VLIGEAASLADDAVVIAEQKLLHEPLLPIRVGHSPDADDAFMFYALAKGKIDTGRYRFQHEMVDIETLNHRALQGELELTAVSVHAYAYLADRYVLCNCGASMGDRYGPMVVARRKMTLDQLAGATIAVPGTRTTAFLALQLCLGVKFDYVVVPFDQIFAAVKNGTADVGLIIHNQHVQRQAGRLGSKFSGRFHGLDYGFAAWEAYPNAGAMIGNAFDIQLPMVGLNGAVDH